MRLDTRPLPAPVTADDDGPALLLLAALATQARKDAERGSDQARAWLAELQSCRPRNMRLLDRAA